MDPRGGLLRAMVIPLALGLTMLVTPIASSAIMVVVEAESYVDSYDTGGASIMPVLCTSASEGYAVDGLDLPGEWIELKATVQDEACYELLVGFQAPWAETIGTLVTIYDEGHSTVEGSIEFELVGEGLG